MGQAAIPLMIASTAIAAGAAIQQGRAAKQAESFRQEQLERQGVVDTISRLDQANDRRRELALELGEQSALGAQSGFDPFGAGSSFLALREETERVAEQDLSMIRLIGANEALTTQNAIAQSKLAGRSAEQAGFLKAAESATSGGAKIAQL